MKIAALSTEGIDIVIAKTIPPTRDGGSPFYCISHGDVGRQRWEIRIPLNNSDFPTEAKHPKIELFDDNLDLIIVDHKRDMHDNPGLIIRRGVPDNRWLLLWNLSPGINGGAQYKVEGQATIVANGITTQEEGSRRGQADCPIVLVDGPCSLTWYREGNVYGQQRAWCATYDGDRWTIVPIQDDWVRVLSELTGHKHDADD